MINDGVDIIDIGGESTRPTHTPVGEEEELNRVVPVIKALREKNLIYLYQLIHIRVKWQRKL